MTDTPFGPWVRRIEALAAEGRARGWVTRAEVRAALGNPAAPAALVEEWLAALQAQGIRVTEAPQPPLLDSMTEAVKRLIERGKARGYVTYDEVNAALPQDQASTELIEDTLATLSEIGIAVVEAEGKDD
ncbi:RNA polymerase sigma factor region1.1 domain-containing protein [Dankookia sp. GCM10030260]|uniref:RNA polymerase sigma factor region1.1 domain-containing protein n=1 Tax=Dankookia sp. GCM10030260 TaxID=3273390 RepID=UPI0036195846